jgi:Cys/Met metabolism PLP-dependent enzyme
MLKELYETCSGANDGPWRQGEVLQRSRVKLKNGFECTKESPTSVPTTREESSFMRCRSVQVGKGRWGTKEDAPGHGLEMTFADAGDNEALRAAIRPGQIRLVWIEMPSIPIWTVTETAEAARCAHDRGALLAVRSTVLTPVLTRPIPSSARSQCSDGCGRSLATSSPRHTLLLSM